MSVKGFSARSALEPLPDHPSQSPPTIATHKPAQSPKYMDIASITSPPTNPSLKLRLSPPIRTFQTPIREEREDSMGRPRKFWRSATGHRRGDDITPINAPTHFRRPLESISRPEPPPFSPKTEGVRRMAPPLQLPGDKRRQSTNAERRRRQESWDRFGRSKHQGQDQDRKDSMERPRKFWKSATGHRRGIAVDDMTPINGPTHFRRPPESILRPGPSDFSPKTGGVPRMTPPRSCPGPSEDGALVRSGRVDKTSELVRALEMRVVELEKERDELKARSEKAGEKVQWFREMMDG